MNPKRVLLLCTGNSARSQMAEGLVNHFLGERWEAHSAGTAPAEHINPLAVKVMAELGIDISSQRPKSVKAFRGMAFDLLITLGAHAANTCPLWLDAAARMHIGLIDPAVAGGSEAEQMAVFRRVRDQLRNEVIAYLQKQAGGEMRRPSYATDYA